MNSGASAGIKGIRPARSDATVLAGLVLILGKDATGARVMPLGAAPVAVLATSLT